MILEKISNKDDDLMVEEVEVSGNYVCTLMAILPEYAILGVG